MTINDAELSGLRADADRFCQNPIFRRSLWRHLSPKSSTSDAPAALDTTIHPDDQMLGHSLRHHGDAHVAVSQYFNVALQQLRAMRQILDVFHPTLDQRFRFLDFACGYGRLIRLLSLLIPPGQITGSDIQPDAVRFVEERFGVRGVASDLDPARFSLGDRFDFIWVASLFSHLPENLFLGWLERLWALLDHTNGVLCISVHDASLLPAGLTLPDTGILYGEGSEISTLTPTHYGTAYVSESFVRAAVAQATDGNAACLRIPKALAHEQDVYVITRRPEVAGLADFRRGPWGWVDERAIVSPNELYLRGWAASLDDGPLDQVQIRIDGRLHHCETGQHRPDVGDAFGNPALSLSGWEFRYTLPAATQKPYVEVSAQSADGECALLYAGYPARKPRTANYNPARSWLRRLLGQ